MAINKKYTNPYGLWQVTTEGDCEGRSVRNLGVHRGSVHEIALYLGDRAFYSLRFKKVDPSSAEELHPTADSVNVSFDIESGTWKMTPAERAAWAKGVFQGEKCHISEGKYFASFIISSNEPESSPVKKAKEALRAAGLNPNDFKITQ